MTEEKFQKVVTLVDSYLVHELALIVARFLTSHEFFTELRFPGFAESINPIRKVLILNTGAFGSSTLFKQIDPYSLCAFGRNDLLSRSCFEQREGRFY